MEAIRINGIAGGSVRTWAKVHMTGTLTRVNRSTKKRAPEPLMRPQNQTMAATPSRQASTEKLRPTSSD
jgi:hypothetical protein